MKNIIFRCDGGILVGSGHVMRCLSIADAFKKLGYKSIFIIADSAMQTAIKGKGYENIILETDYREMEQELSVVIKIMESFSPIKVIIDSYFVTENYLKSLTDKFDTVYIDDVNTFKYPVKTIINYNIYGEKLDYSHCCKIIIGTEYAPLRSEFQHVKTVFREKVENIFISTGGSDFGGVALALLKKLTESKKFSGVKFNIVVGSLAETYGDIIALSEKHPEIIVHGNVKVMAKLMNSCDLAVSASGSTLYELCAVGVPTLNYTLADNQILGAECFSSKGLMVYCGDTRQGLDMVLNAVEDNLYKLINNRNHRKQFSEKLQNAVNKYGADNLVGQIVKG